MSCCTHTCREGEGGGGEGGREGGREGVTCWFVSLLWVLSGVG